MGIEIVDSIDALLPKVNVVFLESVNGRPHLAQATAGAEGQKAGVHRQAGAGSLADAVAIFRLASHRLDVRCFSSSSLRFSGGILASPRSASATCWAAKLPWPVPHEPHHPDLFWYGIHGVETLFTIMGPAAELSRVQTEGVRFGRWPLERRSRRDLSRIRPGAGLRRNRVRHRGDHAQRRLDGYRPLVVEIVKFFKSGKPPVSAGKRSRSTPSWKPPTKANAKRRPGDPRKRDGESQGSREDRFNREVTRRMPCVRAHCQRSGATPAHRRGHAGRVVG